MMIQKSIRRIREGDAVDRDFYYCSLRHLGLSDPLAKLFIGATIKHMPREKLARVAVSFPCRRLIELFQNQVHPIEIQITSLRSSSHQAAEARDLLLPRLTTGKVAE